MMPFALQVGYGPASISSLQRTSMVSRSYSVCSAACFCKPGTNLVPVGGYVMAW